MTEKVGDQAPYTVLNLVGATEFLGDEQAVLDLLQPLVLSLSKDIGDIERLLDEGDMATIARTLHSLKGFIPVFCHPELAGQLVEVEKRSRTDASAPAQARVKALLEPLRQLVRESTGFLQQARH